MNIQQIRETVGEEAWHSFENYMAQQIEVGRAEMEAGIRVTANAEIAAAQSASDSDKAALNATIAGLNDQIEALTAQNSALTQQLSDSSAANAELSAQISAANTELAANEALQVQLVTMAGAAYANALTALQGVGVVVSRAGDTPTILRAKQAIQARIDAAERLRLAAVAEQESFGG